MKIKFSKTKQRQIKKELAEKLKVNIDTIIFNDYFYDSSDDSMHLNYEIDLSRLNVPNARLSAYINNWSDDYWYIVL